MRLDKYIFIQPADDKMLCRDIHGNPIKIKWVSWSSGVYMIYNTKALPKGMFISNYIQYSKRPNPAYSSEISCVIFNHPIYDYKYFPVLEVNKSQFTISI